MRAEDVADVVRVHMAAFPSFFLTFLGPRFLRELYRGIIDDPTCIAFVAVRDGRCAGFVAGTDTPARFYSRLLRRRFLRFGLASVGPLLRRPIILRRLLRAFGKAAGAPPATARRAELMSLAVDPGVQGGGGGALLVERFVDEAAQRGAASVYLTTDARDNDAVNRFYERRGFVRVRDFATPEGRAMNEYERMCRA